MTTTADHRTSLRRTVCDQWGRTHGATSTRRGCWIQLPVGSAAVLVSGEFDGGSAARCLDLQRQQLWYAFSVYFHMIYMWIRTNI